MDKDGSAERAVKRTGSVPSSCQGKAPYRSGQRPRGREPLVRQQHPTKGPRLWTKRGETVKKPGGRERAYADGKRQERKAWDKTVKAQESRS